MIEPGTPDGIQGQSQKTKEQDERVKNHKIRGKKAGFFKAGVPSGYRCGKKVERNVAGNKASNKGYNQPAGMVILLHCMGYTLHRGDINVINMCRTDFPYGYPIKLKRFSPILLLCAAFNNHAEVDSCCEIAIPSPEKKACD
jgi:hypothetical protein